MNLPLVLAEADSRVYHQLARLQSMTEWWQWFGLISICLAVVVYVVVMYRKDCGELSRGLSWGLTILRCAAFAGVLFYFLDLEKREERLVVRNSRTAVLVDTSLSMGIQDGDVGSSHRRIDDVIEAFGQHDLLGKLQARHDVVVYRFDQHSAPAEVASFPRRGAAGSMSTNDSQHSKPSLAEARTIALAGAVILVLSLLSFAAYQIFGRRTPPRRAAFAQQDDDHGERDGSWAMLIGMVCLIAGVVVLGIASLRHPELPFLAIIGVQSTDMVSTAPNQPASTAKKTEPSETPLPSTLPWAESLAPRGVETRLGDAVRAVVNSERGGPIAALVVLSDGGNNAGSDYLESVTAARSAGIPVFCVGIGSDRRPVNVRLVDMDAPPRVYPGDAFPITGYLQAFGFSGRSVKVELVSSAVKSQDDNSQQTIEDTQQITLAPDGELISVKFEVTPKQTGLRNYRLRVAPPNTDTDNRDNERSANVQVVDRKNHVLLFAGSAARDFQFLRNMLFRDKDTTVDVLLQTGVPGISQEADELLFEFPSLAEQLFDYDCIVAFDPDWTKLDEQQINLVEKWVAEKAGGLVLVAGTVETPKLMENRSSHEKLDAIRGLYPVSFYSRGSATLSLSRTSSESAWPITFTRDGEESDFLRLEDEPVANSQAWTSYPGIYGFFAIKDPKPGAKVFARFSDPNSAVDGELPVYMAAQFYGAGRVFFQGSGEVFRLRQVSDAYFEKYYTKLIRWVSQGRLLRDSSRGMLLVDKDRCLLGDTITVQSVLNDSQHEPLTAVEVASVLVHPDGRRTNLPLRRVENAPRPGMYTAQFSAALEGDYRIELPMPGPGTEELLVREVRARIPALETEHPERNDALLTDLAQKTGGAYFRGVDAALGRTSGVTPLSTLVVPQDQKTYLPRAPDKQFDRLLMTWLMGIICGALCVEWLLRRLNKLA